MPSKYVVREPGEDGKEITTILEEGHITPNNISKMRFVFGTRSDITASLDKRNAENPNPRAPKNNGRTGYAGIEAQYPDDEKSSKMVLTDCIIQYRANAFGDLSGSKNKDTAKDYGINYVQLGIPKSYLDRVFSEATRHNIRMANRANTREKNGYYWVNCDISKVNPSDICIIFQHEGEDRVINDSVRQILSEMQSNLTCTVTVTVSCTTTTATREHEIDLERASYHPTIRPFEITMEQETDIEGPELGEISNVARNETSEKTDKNLAQGKLLKLALGRMKISG